MKQLLFAIVVSLTITTVSVQGQSLFQTQLPPFTAENAISVGTILKTLAAQYHFALLVDTDVNTSRSFTGTLPAASVYARIDQLLELIDADGEFKPTALIVHGKQFPPQMKDDVARRQKPTTPSEYRSATDLPRGEIRPDAPNPWDRVEWMRTQGYKQFMDTGADHFALLYARKQEELAEAASYVDTRGYYGPYGYPGYFGPAATAATLRVQGMAAMGWLKFYTDGDKDFTTHLAVLRKVGDTYVNACAAGKSFRIWQSGCEMPVGIWTLRFELREGGMSRYYEENVEIFSSFTAQHPQQYPINREMFDSWLRTQGMKRQEIQ
jgi:hypothetical protein